MPRLLDETLFTTTPHLMHFFAIEMTENRYQALVFGASGISGWAVSIAAARSIRLWAADREQISAWALLLPIQPTPSLESSV